MNTFKISTGYVGDMNAAYMRARIGSRTVTNPQLKVWEATFKNLNFYVGEKPFGKKGIGNMTISKAQLQEIESNPEKRTEFEKILKDCDKTVGEMKIRGGGKKLVSQGFVYSDTGELHGWTIGKNYNGTNSKYICKLNLEMSSRWFGALTTYMKSTDPDAFNWSKRFGR